MTDHVLRLFERSFNCPWCGALAQMEWLSVWLCEASSTPVVNVWAAVEPEGLAASDFQPSDYYFARCAACTRRTLWAPRFPDGHDMVWPSASLAEPPHQSMPSAARDLYEEARQVALGSPRAAAALLRAATESLLRETTGDTKSSLSELIGKLTQQGRLPQEGQQAADLLRLSGNDAVHPNMIQEEESSEQALSLFELINYLSECLIRQPGVIAEMFQRLPENKRDHIQHRDQASGGGASSHDE